MTHAPKRFSVSAFRDFSRCSWYYKLARVDKVPEERITHHRWAGSLLHAAFQLAYGEPVQDPTLTGRNKTRWDVDNAGTIEDSMELFEMLWEGERSEDDPLVGPSRAQRAYDALSSDDQLTPPDLNQFANGQTVGLGKSGKNGRLPRGEIRDNWKVHYGTMLQKSLEVGLMYDVTEIEREAHYEMGGVPMIGYIDLVMRHPSGAEVYADLKSGWNLPQDKELALDDQMASYYRAAGPGGEEPGAIWYFHMKTQSIVEIARNEPLIAALEETAPVIAQKVADGDFVRRISKDCASCSRLKSCMT